MGIQLSVIPSLCHLHTRLAGCPLKHIQLNEKLGIKIKKIDGVW